MADNVSITPGAGAVVSTDEVTIDAVPQHVQRVKLGLGANNAWDMDLDSGQQTMADSVPVVIASNQSSVPVNLSAALPAGTNAIGKLSANDGVNIGAVDVRSISAGTTIIGKVGIDQTAPGTTNGVQVVAALPTGSNAIGKLAANSGVDIGDIDIISIIPGYAATNLGKRVDDAAGGTDVGVALLAIRDDALSTLSQAEGKYVHSRNNSVGALWVAPYGQTQVINYANNISIYNLSLPSSGTQYSQLLPDPCYRISVQCKTDNAITISYVDGMATYITVKVGASYDSGPISFSGSKTIYIKGSANSLVAEIECQTS